MKFLINQVHRSTNGIMGRSGSAMCEVNLDSTVDSWFLIFPLVWEYQRAFPLHRRIPPLYSSGCRKQARIIGRLSLRGDVNIPCYINHGRNVYNNGRIKYCSGVAVRP